ncbi:endonuclease III domain-containing protein [Candidatus Woesearchaeota archaeon]|nr:endonuclease III domain-containing protein [Candidatus Woesearchaeota archaeon]
MRTLQEIYDALFDAYGPQGWWPILTKANTPSFDDRGYGKGSYDHPSSPNERFEVVVGAILTQNTAWSNVEKALGALHQKKLIDPASMMASHHKTLAAVIRPAGYFNQKAKRLKVVSLFFAQEHDNGYKIFEKEDLAKLRSMLLAVSGIGPETADSMLLYAFHLPSFVIDAYTKRIFSRMGLISKDASYDDVKAFFESRLAKQVPVFKEYHALIVEHAKRHCKSKPVCDGCPLRAYCRGL